MANPNDADAVEVSFVADEGSANALAEAVENAIATGFKDGFNQLSKFVAQMLNQQKALRPLQKGIDNLFDPKQFDAATHSLEGFSKELTNIVGALKRAGGIADTTINETLRGTNKLAGVEATKLRQLEISERRQTLAEIKQVNSEKNIEAQRAAQRENILIRQAGQERLQNERANLDSIGRAERAASEQALARQRSSARIRVALVKGMVDSIQALERGLGTAISGIARTTTSAFSKAFAGLGNLVKRNNREFTEGLTTSLNHRESIMRSSFRTQERIVSQSVSRQEKQLIELRTLASKGVTGAVTGRGIGFGIGGLIAGIGLGQILKQGFTDSTNLTEQLNKNRVVFGQLSDDVIAFSRNSVDALLMTQAQALEATGTFGNLFRSLDIGEAPAAEMSKSLTTLAADLASFNNTSVDDAFQALRSGLTGETEPLKRFGVTLNDARLKAKALELGLYSGKGILDAQAKAYAAYALILDDTTLAQGDLARTIDEGANAQRHAIVAGQQLASTIAGKLKGAITILSNAAVPFFKTLTDLVSGENLSAGMKVLRDGLEGAAIALSGLLAAKAGVEVIKLLGLALQFALTPMGLLIVGAAALGAGFKILIERSEPFRKAMEELGVRLGILAQQVIDRLTPAFNALVGFFEETVIPGIVKVADYIGDHLINAIDRTISFVTDTAIPALRQFATFIAERLGPIVKSAGDAIGNAFEFAREKVGEFLTYITPLIQPAIDGFIDLASAIGDAIGGNFSTLGSGALSALKGLGGAFKNIGQEIATALKPAAAKVVDFFKGIFTQANLEVALNGLLDLVEKIGFIIGNIATDRRVVAAAIALVGFATAVGARFIIGLAKGILDNIPEVASLLASVGESLFKSIFDSKVLLSVLVASIAIPGVLKLFRSLGQTAGRQFSEGLGVGVKKGFDSSRDFFGTLFGGLGGTSAGLKRANREFRIDIAQTQRQLQMLGSQMRVDLDGRNLDGARTEVQRLRGEFTQAQLKGLELRDAIKATGEKVKTVFGGAGGITVGVGQLAGAFGNFVKDFSSLGGGKGIFTRFNDNFKSGLGTIRNSFKNTMADLKAISQSQGASLGKLLGASIVSGVAGAFAGFAAGKVAGEAGVNPLLTALGTGFGVGAFAGPAVGVVVGAAALIGSAFGSADKAAKDFQQSVETLAGSIEQDLGPALQSGIDKTVELADILAKGEDSAFRKAFVDMLDPSTLVALQKANIDLDDIFNTMNTGAELVGAAGLGGALTDVNDAIRATCSGLELVNARTFVLGDVTKGLGGLRNEAGNTESALQKIGSAVETAPITDAISTVQGSMQGYQDVIALTQQKFDTLFNPTTDLGSFQTIIDNAIIAVSGLAAQLETVTAPPAEGEAPKDPLVTDAQIRLIQGEITTKIGEAVAAGVDQGFIVDENTARIYTASILQATLNGIPEGPIKDQLKAAIEAGYAGVRPLINEQGAAELGVQTGNAVQKYLDEHGLVPKLEAGGTAAAEALNQLQLYFTTNPVEPGIKANSEDAKAAAKSIVDTIKGSISGTALEPAGAAVTEGLIRGLGSRQASLKAAAQKLADTIIITTKDGLAIRSPSKVMYDIGEEVGAGLYNGIADSTQDIASLISDTLDEVIDALNRKGSGISKAAQSIVSGLFNATVGPNSQGSGLNALALSGGITGALNNIRSTFDSVISDFFAANIANTEGTATNAQRDLLGENPFGLNVADVVGNRNREAIAAAFSQVADLGADLLANGFSPQEVADRLNAYVFQIEALTDSLGITKSEVLAMADAFGLSGPALEAFVANAAKASNAANAAASALDANRAAAAAKEAADAAEAARFPDRNGDGIDDNDQEFTADRLPRRAIEVNVFPAHGNPVAIALEVANAIAQGAKVPLPPPTLSITGPATASAPAKSMGRSGLTGAVRGG